MSSGAIQVVCDSDYGVGAAWSPNGTILFSKRFNDGLYRVAAAGGEAIAVTKIDSAKHESAHAWPAFLSDGTHFVCLYRTVGDQRNEIRAGSLDGGLLTPIVKADALVGFSAPYLLFVREGNLYAQKLDEGKLRLLGDPRQLATGVGFEESWGSTGASVTRSAISFVPTYVPRAEMKLFDRAGAAVETLHSDDGVGEPAISADGKRLLLSKFDPKKGAADIWCVDLVRGTKTRLTSGHAMNHEPIWAPDGKRFAFTSDRSGMYDVYIQGSDEAGVPSAAWKSASDKTLGSWSPDGSTIFVAVYAPGAGDDIWSVKADGTEPKAIVASPDAEQSPQVSPDGQLLAFTSNRSGTSEVYVRPLGGGASMQVSNKGGDSPRWSWEHPELYYVSRDNVMTVVTVRLTGGAIDAGIPSTLFPMPSANRGRSWTVMPGGRFLIPLVDDKGHGQHLDIILNWRAKLEK